MKYEILDTLFPTHNPVEDERINQNAISQLLLISSKCIIFIPITLHQSYLYHDKTIA